MTNVYIKYNPYTVESEIKIDGVLVQKPNKLAEFTNQRMQVWIDDLIPVLNEMCNDDNYEIEFYGTSLDYNDLTICINDYCYKNSDVSVRTSFTEAKSSEHRFQELISLFNDMQKNCPFEDLTTDQIKENFNKAISSEFEVSVIATMSSGKSTLINSLLGREFIWIKQWLFYDVVFSCTYNIYYSSWNAFWNTSKCRFWIICYSNVLYTIKRTAYI